MTVYSALLFRGASTSAAARDRRTESADGSALPHPGRRVVGHDTLNDLVNLSPVEFGEHRQRQNFVGRPLRFRKVTGVVAEIAIRRLKVDRDRIMDSRL